MSALPSVIDIERLVLRDPAFTAERGERIRLALSAELQQAFSFGNASSEVSLDAAELARIEVDPSDADEEVARRLAVGILKSVGLARGDEGA